MTEYQTIEGHYDLLNLHRAHPERYPFLLESVVQGVAARYDILFGFPGQTLELSDLGTIQGAGLGIQSSNFLDNFDTWWQAQRTQAFASNYSPFHGGWFVYLGYELAGQIEPRLSAPVIDTALPVAFTTRIPAAIIQDHLTGRTILVAEPGYATLLEQMRADLKATYINQDIPGLLLQDALEEEEPERFLAGVRQIKRYIVEGDVFQVNLSRRWSGHVRDGVSAGQLYARLRSQNPAPFAGLACYRNTAIISSSPERLIESRDGIAQTRPIAGTRPRAQDHAADRVERSALLAHPKERAEHIMLIDLERNDLGRVCIPGSIKVDELMVIESYSHVHHIVSNIQGRLRPSVTPGQVLRAVFPGGTITGCPKVRCMEIIAELEQSPRGAYTGAMGYINRDGSMDMNILIRTLVMHKQDIMFRTGAGIVADSIPTRELQETRAKARGLILALA